MKCTRILPSGIVCGKETEQPCPPIWIKHAAYDPRVLKIFFLGTDSEQHLHLLDAFVCSEHRPEWQKELAKSLKLQKKTEPEYAI